jgi:hypothetical protein
MFRAAIGGNYSRFRFKQTHRAETVDFDWLAITLSTGRNLKLYGSMSNAEIRFP